MTILLLDAGNSRLKWATSIKAGELLQTGMVELPPQNPLPLLKSLASGLNPQAIHVANVRGADFRELLREWVAQRWQSPVIFHQTVAHGWQISNGYSVPEQLGIDRWAALVGARRLCKSPVCVIDCGTAVTIDVLDAQGRHLGGMISPGLKMMQIALQERTAGLLVTLPTEIPPTHLAQNTGHGIVAGTTNAVLGLIERQQQRLKDTHADLVTMVTGGDAEMLLPYLEGQLRHEPQLVLQGLSVMAQEVP